MDMEIRMQDVRERYRTLQLYDCDKGCEKEIDDANALQQQWQALKDDALTRDRRMLRVKERFAAVTTEQVGDFVKECEELAKQFKLEGPGSGDVSLEEGVDLMKKFDIDVKRFEKRRLELVMAQTYSICQSSSTPSSRH
jgi:hypothetical protein